MKTSIISFLISVTAIASHATTMVYTQLLPDGRHFAIMTDDDKVVLDSLDSQTVTVFGPTEKGYLLLMDRAPKVPEFSYVLPTGLVLPMSPEGREQISDLVDHHEDNSLVDLVKEADFMDDFMVALKWMYGLCDPYGPQGRITDAKVKYNYEQGDCIGMLFSIDIAVQEAEGHSVSVSVYFYDEDGYELRDRNKQYYDVDGLVCTSTKSLPVTSNDFTYSGLKCFIPYGETDLPRNNTRYHLFYNYYLFDDTTGDILYESDNFSFYWDPA